MAINEKNWENFFYKSNEGLGTFYDRILIEKFTNKIIEKYKVKNVLEYPILGLNGITGLNSIFFAKRGIKVTLVDNNKKRIKMIEKLWEKFNLKAKFVYIRNLSEFKSKKKYDLIWNIASLWLYKDGKKIIENYSNLTKKLAIVIAHNKKQLSYNLWKYLDKDFFKNVNEKFIDEENIEKSLSKNFKIIKKEWLVNTPWPGIILNVNFNEKKRKIIEKPEFFTNTKKKKIIEKLLFFEKMPLFIRKKRSHLVSWTCLKK